MAEPRAPVSGAPPDGETPLNAAENASAQDEKKSRWGPGLRFCVKWVVIGGVVAALFLFVLGIQVQHGNRMYPFLMDGDLVITYKLEACRVGDVVAYRRPDTGETALSRIVAVGEDTVEATVQGELIIGGSLPEERVFYLTKPLEGSEVEYPYTLSENQFFLLDDFRTEGQDSRLFGAVSGKDILGKVVYVLRRRGI